MEEGKKRYWKNLSAALIVLALALLASAVFWPLLPDPMPKHWSHGVVDSTMPKRWGVLMIPAIMALFVAVPSLVSKLLRLGRIGPQTQERQDEERIGGLMAAALLTLLLAVHIGVLLAASGFVTDIQRVMTIVIGLSLIPIGNVVSKLRRNAFIGIRTPWAYASDEVWLRTQRFGGRALIVAGLLATAIAATGGPVKSLRWLLIGVAMSCFAYSWWTHRQWVNASGKTKLAE
jgi:uncharacterized membrane protein